MEGSSTGHAPHAKHVEVLSFAGNARIGFIPVHTGFFSPTIRLRNEQFLVHESQRHLACARSDEWCIRPLPPLVVPLRSGTRCDGRCAVVSVVPSRSASRIASIKPSPPELRTLTYRSLTFSRNRTEHCFPVHAPMNPSFRQSLGSFPRHARTLVVSARIAPPQFSCPPGSSPELY